MPIPLNAEMSFINSNAPRVVLRHRVVTLRNRQRRLRFRGALVPEVDLESYRFRAVIDWISFSVHFGRLTQVQHVQNLLRPILGRNSHIVPMDEGLGGVFSSCTIKVQEPPSLAVIAKICRALSSTFGEAAESRVTGIEASLDALPSQSL